MPVSSERRPRVVVIMPARNSAKTLEDTFRAIPAGVAERVILVDNASKDDTVAIAERLGIQVVRHAVDRGYGGSIKTCFRTALEAEPDFIFELHPDNQYDPRYLPALLEKVQSDRYAIVMGSRFLPARRALEGGMPFWKYVNNRILTLLNGLMLGVHLSEFHSGQRIYNAAWVRSLRLEHFSNDFTLAFQLLGQAVQDGWKIGEIPAFSRYFPEMSSNPLLGSIRYGLGTLSESCRVLMYRVGITMPRKHAS